jgi:hypothetical protein
MAQLSDEELASLEYVYMGIRGSQVCAMSDVQDSNHRTPVVLT